MLPLFFHWDSLALPFSVTANDPHTVEHAVDGQACPVENRRSDGKPCDDVIQELALTMSHQQATRMLTNLQLTWCHKNA